MTLSVLSGSAAGGVALGLAFVFGMVFPLFVMALIWDKARLGERRLFQARLIKIRVGGRTLVTNTVNLAVAIAFAVMGIWVITLAGSTEMTGGGAVQSAIGDWLASTLGRLQEGLSPCPSPPGRGPPRPGRRVRALHPARPAHPSLAPRRSRASSRDARLPRQPRHRRTTQMTSTTLSAKDRLRHKHAEEKARAQAAASKARRRRILGICALLAVVAAAVYALATSGTASPRKLAAPRTSPCPPRPGPA